MTTLLLGSGSRLAWAKALLAAAGGADAEAAEVPLASPEALRGISADPPELVLLVDPVPFAAEDPAAAALPPADRLRADATRAVFALEVARRARRTVTLAGDASTWPALLDAAAPSDPPPQFPPPPVPVVPDPVAAVTDSFLSPLWSAAATGRPCPVVLPAGVFFDGDAPGQPMPAAIEVAGRARIVAYGPYLPLPAGAWSARAWLGFSPDIGRMPFILEVDTGGGVARGFFEAERGGFFSLDLDFRVDDPLHPLELRLITQDSALEGQAALIEVRLEPAQSVP